MQKNVEHYVPLTLEEREPFSVVELFKRYLMPLDISTGLTQQDIDFWEQLGCKDIPDEIIVATSSLRKILQIVWWIIASQASNGTDERMKFPIRYQMPEELQRALVDDPLGVYNWLNRNVPNGDGASKGLHIEAARFFGVPIKFCATEGEEKGETGKPVSQAQRKVQHFIDTKLVDSDRHVVVVSMDTIGAFLDEEGNELSYVGKPSHDRDCPKRDEFATQDEYEIAFEKFQIRYIQERFIEGYELVEQTGMFAVNVINGLVVGSPVEKKVEHILQIPALHLHKRATRRVKKRFVRDDRGKVLYARLVLNDLCENCGGFGIAQNLLDASLYKLKALQELFFQLSGSPARVILDAVVEASKSRSERRVLADEIRAYLERLDDETETTEVETESQEKLETKEILRPLVCKADVKGDEVALVGNSQAVAD